MDRQPLASRKKVGQNRKYIGEKPENVCPFWTFFEERKSGDISWSGDERKSKIAEEKGDANCDFWLLAAPWIDRIKQTKKKKKWVGMPNYGANGSKIPAVNCTKLRWPFNRICRIFLTPLPHFDAFCILPHFTKKMHFVICFARIW